MFIDFWYGDTRKDVSRASCFFYPNKGIYSGTVYNKDGKAIGDYTEANSTEIEKEFPGIFGE